MTKDSIPIKAGEFIEHAGRHPDDFGDVHGGNDFRSRNEWDTRLVVCNTRKPTNHLIADHISGRISQIAGILIRHRNRCVLINTKSLLHEECITQHRLVVGDFRLRVEGFRDKS